MKRAYWEKIAPAYNDEIFDVLQNDKKGLIISTINKYASKRKTVIDIGCAIGKWLPVLSPLFKKVIAVDISAENLKIARQLYPQLKNVEYLLADMSSKKTKLPRCEFGICINAILTPSLKERNIFLQSMADCIIKGGRIIITIPSLESFLLTNIIQQQWGIDKYLFPAVKNTKDAARQWNNIRQGNVDIDHVPHKHYLKEELQLILSNHDLIVEELHKIEYNWISEFHHPPKWLKQPYPWDWMVIAKKL